jgi:hypothetical protein
MMHEFCHGQAQAITPTVFCYFLALPMIHIVVVMIHIPTIDNFTIANERWSQNLNNFLCFFLTTPCAN